jgi:hypothetical protein
MADNLISFAEIDMSAALPSMLNFYKSSVKKSIKKPDVLPPNNSGFRNSVLRNITNKKQVSNANKLRLASLSAYSKMTKRGGKKSKTRKSRK